MKKYEFFPHTADVLFEGYGKTVENLFENCGLAVESIMVGLDSLDSIEHYEILFGSDNLEDLLYDFLSELIYLKDSDGLLFNKFAVIITHENKKYKLFAQCYGEFIKRDKHELIQDAKAVTKHQFEIKQEKNKTWFAKVIVDV